MKLVLLVSLTVLILVASSPQDPRSLLNKGPIKVLCADEVSTYCSEEISHWLCLVSNKDTISGRCRNFIDNKLQRTTGIAGLRYQCLSEKNNICKESKTVDDFIACLKDNVSELSDSCKKSLESLDGN